MKNILAKTTMFIYVISFLCFGQYNWQKGVLPDLSALIPPPGYPGSFHINSVTFGNGRFLAVGDYGVSNYNGANGSITISAMLTSSDGITWELRSFGGNDTCFGYSLTDCGLYSVVYGDSLFVAVGSEQVKFNSQGAVFAAREPDMQPVMLTGNNLQISRFISVMYGNGQFVAVGPRYMGVSQDGLVWSTVDSSSYMFNAVCYGKGLYVVVGNNGVILTSPDAINWTNRASGISAPPPNQGGSLLSVAYGNNCFVAGGSGGGLLYSYMLRSTDGVVWTKSDSLSLTIFRSINFENGMFVAAGSQGDLGTNTTGILLYSSDGAVWHRDPNPPSSIEFYSSAYGNGQLVVCDGGPYFATVPPMEVKDRMINTSSDLGLSVLNSQRGFLSIRLPKLRNQGLISVELFAVNGRKVYSESLSPSDELLTISTKSLSKGLYLLHITAIDGHFCTGRFVLAR